MMQSFTKDYVAAMSHKKIDTDPDWIIDNIDKPGIGEFLPIEQREQIKLRARTQIKHLAQGVKQTVKDDIASIFETGQGNPDLKYEDVVHRLGQDEADRWVTNQGIARQAWGATADMHARPDGELYQRLRLLKPEAGATQFADRQRVYEAAEKKIEAHLRQRVEDPAESVAADPDVQLGLETADWSKPSTVKPLIEARMQAQERAGIEPGARSPITTAEALRLTAELPRALPGQDRQVLTAITQRFHNLFGEELADDALVFALRARKVDADITRASAKILRELGAGKQPDRDTAKQADAERELEAAKRATEGFIRPLGMGVGGIPPELRKYAEGGGSLSDTGMDPAIPPPPVPAEFAHINKEAMAKLIELRDVPGIAEQFDKTFQQPKGTGAKILQTYNLRPRSKQQSPQQYLTDERKRLESGG
jgi:hypothetical protein